MRARPAFTLIELLVVLSILGILTASFTLNTRSTRRAQERNLLRETVLATLQQAQLKVRSGLVDQPGENAVFTCFGMRFLMDALPQSLWGHWEDGVCVLDEANVLTGFSPTLGITSLAVENVSYTDLTLWFEPPVGALHMVDGAGLLVEGTLQVDFDDSGRVLLIPRATGLPVLSTDPSDS